ncbi:MAG: calcineurin-like phosphoesterase C-terminal domain-containing protein [Thermodesulfovibrionales bacterium]|nr:calcineurin-like phosphoesterase C-terminal domain-containing protein [Thermodesulfovibrionales bacterium]
MKRFRAITYFTVASLLILLFSFAAYASTNVVRGTVFWDRNGNGIMDRGEPGIPNVAVSNGKEVVLTDGLGRYKLPAYEPMIVFITKPSGYMPPLNSNNQPQFYYIHYPSGSPSAIRQYPAIPPTGPLPDPLNFPLLKIEEKHKFTALIIGDTQTYTDEEIGYLRDTIVKEVYDTDAVFAILMGDNVGSGYLSLYPRLLSVLGGIGKPYYMVAGNHDMNYDSPNDYHSLDTFKRYNGPTYYSFDYGKVHFVVLDSVMYLGNRRYRGEIDNRQLEWLKNDLSLVPKDKLIVLAMHIPLVSFQDRYSTVHQVINRHVIYELLKDRKVVTLGAHTHTLEHFLPGEEVDGWGHPTPIHQVLVGAASGSWWTGDFDEYGIPFSFQRCGAPRGFLLMNFEGSDYTITFKATGMPKERQMSLSFLTSSFYNWYTELLNWLRSDPSTRPERPSVNINNLPDQGVLTTSEITAGVPLIVNVWNGRKDTVVMCHFDEREPIAAIRNMNIMDPYALRHQLSLLRWSIGFSAFRQNYGPAYPQPLPEWLHTVQSPHIWTCEVPRDLQKGVHSVVVTAADVNGNVYSETKIFEIK